MPLPSDTSEAESASAESRPASLWPDSTRGGGSSFAPSRFDPAAEERARAEAQAAAFDVCRTTLALRAALLVQAVLAVVALGGAEDMLDWGRRQAALTFAGATATLVWLVLVCAAKGVLRRAAGPWRVLAALLAGAGAALLGWWPLWWVGLAEAAGGLRPAGTALGGGLMAALLWAWLELRARAWQPANASARLAELQSRIRPHFLFNALNTALALVRVDPARAERVLEDLSELFRVALAEAGTSVTLDEEIELAKAYLAIEQVRFGERLSVRWEIDDAALPARVPPLVLQPLVENAVRHGVEPAHESARVWVRARAKRGQAVVTVSNTLPEQPSVPGHGIALLNVRERLRLLHDVAAQCDTWREGDIFHARIVLPLS